MFLPVDMSNLTIWHFDIVNYIPYPRHDITIYNIIKIIIWQRQSPFHIFSIFKVLKLERIIQTIYRVMLNTLLETFCEYTEIANIAFSLSHSWTNICDVVWTRYSCWTKHMIRIEHCWLKIILMYFFSIQSSSL